VAKAFDRVEVGVWLCQYWKESVFDTIKLRHDLIKDSMQAEPPCVLSHEPSTPPSSAKCDCKARTSTFADRCLRLWSAADANAAASDGSVNLSCALSCLDSTMECFGFGFGGGAGTTADGGRWKAPPWSRAQLSPLSADAGAGALPS
jgi:hypothetical protein